MIAIFCFTKLAKFPLLWSPISIACQFVLAKVKFLLRSAVLKHLLIYTAANVLTMNSELDIYYWISHVYCNAHRIKLSLYSQLLYTNSATAEEIRHLILSSTRCTYQIDLHCSDISQGDIYWISYFGREDVWEKLGGSFCQRGLYTNLKYPPGKHILSTDSKRYIIPNSVSRLSNIWKYNNRCGWHPHKYIKK